MARETADGHPPEGVGGPPRVGADVDRRSIDFGETITVTTTLVVMEDHPIAAQVLLQLLWDDPQINGVPGPTVASAMKAGRKIAKSRPSISVSQFRSEPANPKGPGPVSTPPMK